MAKIPASWMGRRLPTPANRYVAILKQVGESGKRIHTQSPPLKYDDLRKWLQKKDDPKLTLISITYVPLKETENGVD